MTRRHVLGLTVCCALGALFMSNVHFGADEKPKQLRHVVGFKFKDDAKPEQVDAIVKAFGELPSKIEGITGYEWGVNNSPEKLNKGITHCFVVTFKDEKAREGYLPHAAHQAFVAQLKPILDDAFVIDYWTP
jgi:quinol monooxygenase YgiN